MPRDLTMPEPPPVPDRALFAAMCRAVAVGIFPSGAQHTDYLSNLKALRAVLEAARAAEGPGAASRPVVAPRAREGV